MLEKKVADSSWEALGTTGPFVVLSRLTCFLNTIE